MNLYLDCYPCILNQTISAIRSFNIADEIQKEIFDAALELLSRANPEKPPVELVADIHAIIKHKTGVEDLYRPQKQSSTKIALALYEKAKKTIDKSEDPFETAVRLSIAGNVIDYGINRSFDLSSEIDRVLQQPFAINHLNLLREEIDRVNTLLYLADNAGETIFDRLLIETIKKDVIYVVKEVPILNDALEEDAIQAGIDKVAKIISSGVDTPGTVLSRASNSFLDIYYNAELIIAKGQGNFEALSEQNENIFFVLQSKCDTLSRSIGAPVGGLIVKSAKIMI
jgi:damage-control phosphatase, subfamily I